jgi:hypothetical protein
LKTRELQEGERRGGGGVEKERGGVAGEGRAVGVTKDIALLQRGNRNNDVCVRLVSKAMFARPSCKCKLVERKREVKKMRRWKKKYWIIQLLV